MKKNRRFQDVKVGEELPPLDVPTTASLVVGGALASARPVRVAGLTPEAVNARLQRAEIGHELAERRALGTPAGAVYRLTGARVDVSLYSVGEFDVARIAESLGGGGHRNAAGFSVPLRDWLERYLEV